MARDYSEYSIPELQDALDNVDGKRHPANKAALARELQARKDSGEFDRMVREARDEWRRRERRGIRIARHVRKAIAAYLVIAPLYSITGIDVVASSEPLRGIVFACFIVFLVASCAAGIGLFLDKAWAHWIALVVLVLQIVKIQVTGFAFSLLSLVGVYVFLADGPKVGVRALFEPGFTLEIGSEAPLWVGINLLFLPLFAILATAREEMP